jgi:LPS O-antigen subunit length determinant protein (WzzB/FepE family)
MNAQQDAAVADRETTLQEALQQLRSSRLLIAIAAVLVLAMTIVTIAVVNEPYAATAVVAPRATEARGLELGSLASLSELAGGGRRPTFEEFVYLVSSEASARRLLSEKSSWVETLLQRTATQGFVRRSYYAAQNLVRKLAGRERRQPSGFEDAVRSVRKSIETRKTPEGYVTITVFAKAPEESKMILEGVVRASDEMIRVRERATYSERVSVLLSMSEESVRPNERVAISNAIDRDFARYVNSLGSEAFAYQYVVPPRVEPQPRYVNGLLVFVGCSAIVSFGFAAFVLLRVRLRR